MLTYLIRVKLLAYALWSMDVTISEKEIEFVVLNGLPPLFENIIVDLDGLRNEDKLFTLDFMRSPLL